MELIKHGNMTSRQLALEIVDRLDARWNTDLRAIISNEAFSETERLKRLRARMLEAAFAGIDEFQADADISAAAEENEGLIARALAGNDVELEPNLSVTERNYNIIRGYQDAAVSDYVFTLSKRLESMSNAKTAGQLAVETVASGLFTVGTAWAKLTWTAWRTGGQTLLQACRTGITTLGLKTAVAVVIIVLAAILLYLFLENPKKILGVIYNDTDDAFVVKNWNQKGGDLYMEHGEMVNFMQDHATGELDSPLVQIRNRYFFAPGDEDNVVFGGMYFADRNFGLRGSEGMMILSSTTTDLRVAHQFAVPYLADNGTNMRKLDSRPDNLEGLFREMYNGRRVRFDTTSGGYRLVSSVSGARGGVVGLIATITKV